MKVNQKAVKVLEKLLEANYVKERVVSSITVDQMLALRGVSVSDIAMINDLQKRIKEREVLSFFADGFISEKEAAKKPDTNDNSDESEFDMPD